ncbi:50S ribosomal protein L33 [Oenococcus oeni]|uniref:50S ribosomal protein L33 n=1 Tax=Oenococcus oeni TaxID=1247 RepID=UPI0008F95BF5|nr:50S ribosomal protein L33 [Oenococcus oeni]AWW99489.1 50S ribosomal protein L33 [Oenococcus oeni]OIL50900.1 50S ribosomal protein L33 [Oenococcus oeni]OIL52166.1 50S ribosomal protein L33 [Oenococcus oeni]OIL62814.1 50S ribosomal protein L33 [Oenococcus oeni]OIL68275.1 50S ribosomal protein L33 [Oenococcus oeni]
MAGKGQRDHVILGNDQTGERIYLTSKNHRNTPDRLVLKKYSPKLHKVVEFKEVK